MGRVDIAIEVSMMSTYVAMPKERHLQQMFQMFTYLKLHHNSRIAMDPTYPDIEEDKFQKKCWRIFHGKMKEALPPDAPKPLEMFFSSEHLWMLILLEIRFRGGQGPVSL